MEESSIQVIEKMLADQRSFLATHQTKSLKFRIEKLKAFRAAIIKHEKRIADALWTDLHKSPEEAYLTEISLVLHEIDNHIKNLKYWSRPERVNVPYYLLPSSGKIIFEPLGVALIIAPWNYPFQLLMNPLIGAISAGCCAVLKPSPYTPNVAKAMEELITETFGSNYIGIIQGGRGVNEMLLEKRFDIIFFTGSSAFGKVVMKAAANYLTPVVLELGGKSPCIVDSGANINTAAKRIAWGKTINAGQTCIAPDYLFVHKSIKDQLLQKIALNMNAIYEEDSKKSRFFGRIVNQKAVERLQKLLEHGKIISGGEVDITDRYISPTIIDEVKPDFPVMQEEIFGPILPVMSFEDISEVITYINTNEKPLAFYYFGKNKQAKDVLLKTSSGGACINDNIMHMANYHLPFGGVGNSGMGKYHGMQSFLAFSNSRAVVNTPNWIDLFFKYPPFKYFKLVKKII